MSTPHGVPEEAIPAWFPAQDPVVGDGLSNPGRRGPFDLLVAVVDVARLSSERLTEASQVPTGQVRVLLPCGHESDARRVRRLRRRRSAGAASVERSSGADPPGAGP